jgi:DNA primase
MIKNNILYNLNKALEYIKKFNAIILVEGQGDVWKLYESGIYNAVGMFGKSLSCQQIEQINKLPITTIIVITDNDQAGKEAKIQIKRSLGRLYKLIFPVIIEKDIGEMSIEDIKTNIIKQIEGYC